MLEGSLDYRQHRRTSRIEAFITQIKSLLLHIRSSITHVYIRITSEQIESTGLWTSLSMKYTSCFQNSLSDTGKNHEQMHIAETINEHSASATL